MGRRKVDPSKRLRAVRACVQCKHAKKRCNETIPCTNCMRRGLAEACSFDDTQPVSSHRKHTVAVDNGVPSFPLGDEQEHPADGLASLNRATRATQQNTIVSPTSVVSSFAGPTPQSTHPRLLSNAHGQKVYIGPAASLSFLQLVRETVAKSIGSSEFSDPSTRDQMLEAELRSKLESTADLEIPFPKRKEYVNAFLAATRGILGLLPRDETLSIVQESLVATSDSYSSAVACLTLAIGAQCSASDHDSLRIEKASLACAQRIAFSGRLEDPCLEMIQTFLLLAFYMLGACRRNAAFMYLGIAARAAFAVGLHNSDCDRFLSSSLKELSSRAWKSVVCLDLVMSSILGRTPATYGPKVREEPKPDLIHPEVVSLDASFQLSLLVEDIVNSIYQSSGSSVTVAEQHLSHLKQWSSNLSDEVRISKKPHTTGESVRAQIIGSFHLSCYYHFAVMLVSRPFLISHLVAGSEGPAIGRRASISSLESSSANVIDMAEVCVRAAVLMSQTCTDVLESGYLMSNMCIVKAWVFAAGLVLGFQSFSAQRADLEVDEAFMGARSVLQALASRSMQAAHYADILKHLANAIKEQRRRRASRQERGGGMIDKILNLRAAENERQRRAPEDEDSNWINSAEAQFMGGLSAQTSDPQAYEMPPSFDFDGQDLGLDSASFQFWDQFLFDHNASYDWTEPAVDPQLAGSAVHYPNP